MYFQGQPIVIPRFSKMTPILTLILLNKLEVRLSIYLLHGLHYLLELSLFRRFDFFENIEKT